VADSSACITEPNGYHPRWVLAYACKLGRCCNHSVQARNVAIALKPGEKDLRFEYNETLVYVTSIDAALNYIDTNRGAAEKGPASPALRVRAAPRACFDQMESSALRADEAPARRATKSDAGTSVERRNDADARPGATRSGRGLFRPWAGPIGFVAGLARTDCTRCGPLLPTAKNPDGAGGSI
jgi:hypothetical protein